MLSYRIDEGGFIEPKLENYPDGTMKIDLLPAEKCSRVEISWHYENELEQMQLYYMVSNLKERFPKAEFTLIPKYSP